MPTPSKLIDGIPQRHVSTVFGKSVNAYIGEAVAYRLFSPAEDIQVLIMTRDKKELVRAAKILNLELDISGSKEVALVSLRDVHFQVAPYQPVAKPFIEAQTNKPDEEDW